MRFDAERLEVVKGTRTRYFDPLVSPEKREARDITHSTVIIIAGKPYSWRNEFPPRIRIDPQLIRKAREKWGKHLGLLPS